MADDREVASGTHRCGQHLSQGRVALGARRRARAAAHFLHFLSAPENELRGLDGSAEGTGENALDGNAELADCRTDRAGVGPPFVDEIALVVAVFETLHPLIVLAEIGRCVTEVEDIAPFAQFGEQFRRREFARRKRAALRCGRLLPCWGAQQECGEREDESDLIHRQALLSRSGSYLDSPERPH